MDLQATNILLPEGLLQQCPSCGQLVSACTKQRYDRTMKQFDVLEGTAPAGRAKTRQKRRIGSILNKAIHSMGVHPQNMNMLDVGCSSGSVLQVAQMIGVQHLHGVEPAPLAAKSAQELGFDVFSGYLEDAHYASESYELVTMFEVIEHLPDPIPILQEIHRILKPNGILLIGTGNTASWTATILRDKWEYFSIAQNGGHISFFNPKSMARLAKTTGFHLYTLTTKRIDLSSPDTQAGLAIKLSRELLALPARWFNQGHDMLATFRKAS